MTEKTCRRCGQTKNIELFYNNPKLRDGKQSNCKECTKMIRRESTYRRREGIESKRSKTSSTLQFIDGPLPEPGFVAIYVLKNEQNTPFWVGSTLDPTVRYRQLRRKFSVPFRMEILFHILEAGSIAAEQWAMDEEHLDMKSQTF